VCPVLRGNRAQDALLEALTLRICLRDSVPCSDTVSFSVRAWTFGEDDDSLAFEEPPFPVRIESR